MAERDPRLHVAVPGRVRRLRAQERRGAPGSNHGQNFKTLFFTTQFCQVREILDAKGLGGFRFRQIHFGKIAPKVGAIKVYDTPRPDEIMMDMDVEYFGDLDVGISLMKVRTHYKLFLHD